MKGNTGQAEEGKIAANAIASILQEREPVYGNVTLKEKNIRQFLYKSIPLDDMFRAKVLEKLASKYDLLGIPGFYRDSAGKWQMFLRRCGGIFIPVCDKDGYIQGLQMRLDVPSSEKKFRWFSSNHYPFSQKVMFASMVHLQVRDAVRDILSA